MKKMLLIASALGLAVAVGGCNIHKKPVEVSKKQDRVEVSKQKVTLESLDARVTAVEKAVRATNAKIAKALKDAAAAGHPYPYYVK